MLAEVPKLDQLPRESASRVKNKWREVVREVREAGSVAVTNHSEVEMVLVDAATYEQLVARAAALKTRDESLLQQLNAQFDQRLAVLQEPRALNNVAAVFASKGKLARRPKAGSTF
jgi:prevent-host-death family protein